MALKIGQSAGGGDYGRIEDGTYMARLVQVLDLGIQDGEEYMGQVRPPAQKVILTFEFPTERIEVGGEDKPRWLSREYKVSYSEKANLAKVVQALDKAGEANSLDDLLGNPCMVTVGSTKNDKPKITDVTGVPKGFEVGSLENPPVAFDFDNPDGEVFENLPQWIQDRMTSATNAEKLAAITGGGEAPSADFNDDLEELPFDDD